MRFDRNLPKRGPRETVVPMINVVFLLLIFFLMTATVAVPPPFSLALPEGRASQDAGARDVLFMGADGRLAYGTMRGEAVFDALAAREAASPLELRADGAVPASDVTGLLERLAGLGVADIRLVLAVRP